MLSYLRGVSGGQRVKPGLMFLLELAWESRARLPLLIMSGFMALGVRIQLDINVDRAARLVPRLRLEDEDVPTEDEDSSDWTVEDNYEYDDDEEDEEEEEEDRTFEFASDEELDALPPLEKDRPA